MQSPKLVEFPKELNTFASAENFDYELKIIVAGDANAGKTSLIVRFADKNFREDIYLESSTINIECKSQYAKILVNQEEKTVKLNVWDTLGQERYKALTQSYYRGANAVILAIDLTDSKSFQKIDGWIGEIQKQTTALTSIVLVGTKADLVDKRVITTEEMKEIASANSIDYVETSSKTGDEVNKAFYTATKNALQLLISRKDGAESRNNNHITLKEQKRRNDDGCCVIS